MFEDYTVSFFGHRYIYGGYGLEDKIQQICEELIKKKYYVEFLVGRNGDFDRFVSSAIRRAQKRQGFENRSHTLVLPYRSMEYENNQEGFEDFYSNIEICEKSAFVHPKAAIKIRNKYMVDRSDLVICYVEKEGGGAFAAVSYAKACNKKIINLAETDVQNTQKTLRRR